MSLEELQKRRTQLKRNSDITLENMQKITNESLRVADVAYNSKKHLDELDKEFESQTGLQGNDIKFLFAAVGLQVTRIVILNELTKTEAAGSGNRNETALHNFQEKLLGKFNAGSDIHDKPYYASMEHIITRLGVPYDATESLTEKSLTKMLGKGMTWGFDIESMILSENPKLFKGANHRFATLGHDPIVGLLVGTGNIMTNTITCVKTPVRAGGIGIPVLTTNHVVYTTDFKHPKIASYGSTANMLKNVIARTNEQPSAFVASLIKQIIHIGTDLYTTCGIQIPGANLILTNSEAEKLTKYIGAGDIVKVGASATLAELINLLISSLHTLMYDSTSPISRDVYNVRTRKIIMYSNLIAAGSNVLWVAGNMMAGNEGALKQLDIGGLLVTIKRLMTDSEYIRKIKEEFVFGGFNRLIQGENLQLEEVLWE